MLFLKYCLTNSICLCYYMCDNFFPISNFRTAFGFCKNSFRYILDLILPQIGLANNNPSDLTPISKLCIFLDFVRTNSFQRVVGTQGHNLIHQSRACIIINQIAHIIAELHGQVNIYEKF